MRRLASMSTPQRAGLAGAVALILVIAAVVVLRGGGDGGGDEQSVSAATLQISKQVVTHRSVGAPDFAPATTTTALADGDTLRTDSKGAARITYTDGSLTRLGPDTEYTLEKLGSDEAAAQRVGKLEVGRTWHRVTKVTGSGSYEVKTSNAVAAVRGTVFAVICLTRGRCRYMVFEGSVLVRTDIGEEVLLTAGQQVESDEQGHLGPVQPINLDDPFLVENASADGVGAGGTTTTVTTPTTRPAVGGKDPFRSLVPTAGPAPGPVTATSAPGAATTTSRGVTTTTRRATTSTRPATSTTRPGATTTVRPGATTTTTRARGNTTTTQGQTIVSRQGTTSTTAAAATTSTSATTTTTQFIGGGGGGTTSTATSGSTTTGSTTTTSNRGSIQGTVITPEAPVCIVAWVSGDGFGQQGSVQLAASGPYSINNLAPGTGYHVQFSGCGVSDALSEMWNDVRSEGPNNGPAGAAITVVAGQATTGIDATLAWGACILGTVTDDAQQPLATTGHVEDLNGRVVRSFTTDPQTGAYQAAALDPGQYKVYFATPGPNYVPGYYDTQLLEADATVVTVASGTVTTVNQSLHTSAHLTGTVRNASGSPLSNVIVSARTGGYLSQAVTDATGGYQVDYLPSGSYVVDFLSCSSVSNCYVHEFYNDHLVVDAADFLTVPYGATVTGIDAVLTAGAGTVSGQVLDATCTCPLVGATATLDNGTGYTFTSQTGGTGSWVMQGVMPGSYKLFISAPGHLSEYYSDKLDFASADTVTVSANTYISGFDATLDPFILALASFGARPPDRDLPAWVFALRRPEGAMLTGADLAVVKPGRFRW
ncbi:MAG: carboxypeptidase regulatory-like domain-containing protein [Mycobacteriales bacterium]